MSENPAPDNLDWSANQVKAHLLALLNATEKRIEDRFIALEKSQRDALIAQKEAVNAALVAAEKATTVGERNAERWREAANEWRAAMDDREIKFATAIEVDVQFRSLRDRLDKLEVFRANTDGKGQGLAFAAALLAGGIGTLGTIVGLFAFFTK